METQRLFGLFGLMLPFSALCCAFSPSGNFRHLESLRLSDTIAPSNLCHGDPMTNGKYETQDARILAVLKEARDEAFSEGWAAAIHIIVTAATNAAPSSPHAVDGLTRAATETKPPIRRERLPGRKRAPYGLCRRAIGESFKQAGDTGIDLEMVSETGFRMEGGPKLASTSIRSTLIEMMNEGVVDRRNGRWFLVSSKTETAGPAHEANPAAPLFNSEGDSREQAALAH
jgi:hypothetical protein